MLACDSEMTLLLLLLLIIVIVIVELGNSRLVTYIKFPTAEYKRYCLLNITIFSYLRT